MAVEVRTILFDQGELVRASFAFCLRQGLAMDRGRLVFVDPGEEKAGKVRLVFNVQGGGETNIHLTYPQMAAILIMHCRELKIPLPRKHRKTLKPMGDRIALVARTPENLGSELENELFRLEEMIQHSAENVHA